MNDNNKATEERSPKFWRTWDVSEETCFSIPTLLWMLSWIAMGSTLAILMSR